MHREVGPGFREVGPRVQGLVVYREVGPRV